MARNIHRKLLTAPKCVRDDRKLVQSARRVQLNAARAARRAKKIAARRAAGVRTDLRGRAKKLLMPELERVLYRCASRGFTQEQIANLLGISEKALQGRLAAEPRLYSLIKKAQSETIDLATGKLVMAIREGKAWAICFYLKCRAGWHEKLQIGGEIKHTIEEQFAGAVESAPSFVRDIVKQLPKGELVKLKRQYAAVGLPEDGGMTH